MNETIRILVADDHPIVREGMVAVLSTQPDFEVVAEANNGQEAIDLAPQVKGLELPGYEPRSLHSMALGFAVGARGADHNRSGAYEADFSDRTDRRQLSPEDALLAVETENKAAVMDSLILCKFLRGVFDDVAGVHGGVHTWTHI